MSWVKIDDQLHTNEKALDCSLAARGLWLMCLSWVGDKETDGAIPRSVVRLHAGPQWQELSEELVNAGLWDVTEAGWQFHDYLSYNKSHDELEADRNKAKDRMARVRGERRPQQETGSQDVRPNVPRSSATPVPVPVPDSQTTSERESLAVEKHGAAQEADFPPPPETEADSIPRRLPAPRGADRAALGALLAAHRSVMFPGVVPEEFPDCELEAAIPALRKLQKLHATPEKVAEATRRMLAEFGPERTYLSALPGHWTRFTARRAQALPGNASGSVARKLNATEQRLAETDEQLAAASPAIVEATLRKWAPTKTADLPALEGANL